MEYVKNKTGESHSSFQYLHFSTNHSGYLESVQISHLSVIRLNLDQPIREVAESRATVLTG